MRMLAAMIPVFGGISFGRWAKDDPHTPGKVYVELWVRIVAFGRQLELRVTL